MKDRDEKSMEIKIRGEFIKQVSYIYWWYIY